MFGVLTIIAGKLLVVASRLVAAFGYIWGLRTVTLLFLFHMGPGESAGVLANPQDSVSGVPWR